MNNEIELSIIYVYYNSSDVIFDSIKSVEKFEGQINYEIILVINKMDDASVDDFQKFKNLRVIFNDENIGFGRANNTGFDRSTGKYILILNPDTLITGSTFPGMLKFMNENNDIGLSTCKLIDESGNIQKTGVYKRYDIGYILVELFFLYKLPVIKKLFADYFYNEKQLSGFLNPAVISGAFMLFRREVYEQLGGFDPDFFMFGEDKNICLRALKITKIGYNPKATLIHIGAATLGEEPSYQKLNYQITGMMLNIKKLYSPAIFWMVKFFILLNVIIMFPMSYAIRDKTHKNLLRIRSKIFLKKIFAG